jgi:hypothetical protein
MSEHGGQDGSKRSAGNAIIMRAWEAQRKLTTGSHGEQHICEAVTQGEKEVKFCKRVQERDHVSMVS